MTDCMSWQQLQNAAFVQKTSQFLNLKWAWSMVSWAIIGWMKHPSIIRRQKKPKRQ